MAIEQAFDNIEQGTAQPVPVNRTTIPAWEMKLLQDIVARSDAQQRQAALDDYLFERGRRKRYAQTRQRADRFRRTLVGAHMDKVQAERMAALAAQAGLSMTAFTKEAVRRYAEQLTYETGFTASGFLPGR